jgi:hypothetical protein
MFEYMYMLCIYVGMCVFVCVAKVSVLKPAVKREY